MKETMKNTWPYFKKYMWIHILCYFLGVVRMGILLVEPQVLSLLVDRVINPALGKEAVDNSSVLSFVVQGIPSDDFWRNFYRLASILALLVVIYFLSFYARWHLAHYFGMKSEKILRREAIDKFNVTSSQALHEYSSGELLTILNRDPQMMKNLYVDFIPRFIDPVFYIASAAVLLWQLNWKLMIFPVLTGLLFVFVTKKFIVVSKKYFNQVWENSADLNTEIQEGIYGIRTIKAYAREDYEHDLFSVKNERLRNTMFDFGDFRARRSMLYSAIQNGLYIVCIIFGIYLSVNLKMTNGEFTSFLSYLLTMANQFIGISNSLGEIQNCAVSSERLFGFLRKKDDIRESYGKREIEAKPHIEVKHVTVRDDRQKDRPEEEQYKLLDDVSLDLPYGKKLGIMGKTGSGKSVLIKTLQSFMEMSDGEIYIDGKPLHEYSRDSIRRSYGYAMQEVFLFSNTIESNIAYYDPYADEEDIRRCGKAAEVDEFALRFADQYHTVIGEKGFGLSGGQKQRISIARAMLKNAPVLVLDDATSALDLETEKKIFDNIKAMSREKTLIISTHRVSAVKDMDEILFMEDGRIAERGTHEELLALGGRYADIYYRQTGEEVLMDEQSAI